MSIHSLEKITPTSFIGFSDSSSRRCLIDGDNGLRYILPLDSGSEFGSQNRVLGSIIFEALGLPTATSALIEITNGFVQEFALNAPKSSEHVPAVGRYLAQRQVANKGERLYEILPQELVPLDLQSRAVLDRIRR